MVGVRTAGVWGRREELLGWELELLEIVRTVWGRRVRNAGAGDGGRIASRERVINVRGRGLELLEWS